MDFSTIAHRRHDYCSPVSREFVQDLVNAIDLPAEARCADFGCGKGQLLTDVLCAYKTATGRGYDKNEEFIREATTRAAQAGLSTRARFRVRDIETTALRGEAVDLAICFGSAHIFDGFANTVRTLSSIVRPGGMVLVADGYWKCKPSEHYLREFFDSTENDLLYVSQMLDALDKANLTAPYLKTSTDHEWERYEGLWARELELAAQSVEDPESAAAMHARAQKSRNNYWIHGGRETLGYIAILATKG